MPRDFEKFSAALREGKLYQESSIVRTIVEEYLAIMRELVRKGEKSAIEQNIIELRSWMTSKAPTVIQEEKDGEPKRGPSEQAVREFIFSTYGPDRFIGVGDLLAVFPDAVRSGDIPPPLPPWDIIDKHMKLGHMLRLRLSKVDQETPATVESMINFATKQGSSVSITVGDALASAQYVYIDAPKCEWVFTMPTIDEDSNNKGYIEQINTLLTFLGRVYPKVTEMPDGLRDSILFWSEQRSTLATLREASDPSYGSQLRDVIRTSELDRYRPSAASIVQDMYIDFALASDERKFALLRDPPALSSSFGLSDTPVVVNSTGTSGDRYNIALFGNEFTKASPAVGSRFEVPHREESDTDTTPTASPVAAHV